MDFVFTEFSDSGCFLLLDTNSGFQPDKGCINALNHVLDPDGKSHLIHDYKEGTWFKVWTEAVAELRRTSTNGKFTLILCGEGTFSVRVKDAHLTIEEQARVVQTWEEPLYLRSGQLAIAEGMILFESLDDFREEVSINATLPSGWYTIRIHQMVQHHSVSPTIGFYGSDESPAIVLEFVFTNQDQVQIPSEAEPFPRLKFPEEALSFQSGAYCYATVEGIKDDWVVMRLQLTHTTSCRHGKMPFLQEGTIKIGDVILVKLLEDKHSFWLVEWEDKRANLNPAR